MYKFGGLDISESNFDVKTFNHQYSPGVRIVRILRTYEWKNALYSRVQYWGSSDPSGQSRWPSQYLVDGTQRTTSNDGGDDDDNEAGEEEHENSESEHAACLVAICFPFTPPAPATAASATAASNWTADRRRRGLISAATIAARSNTGGRRRRSGRNVCALTQRRNERKQKKKKKWLIRSRLRVDQGTDHGGHSSVGKWVCAGREENCWKHGYRDDCIRDITTTRRSDGFRFPDAKNARALATTTATVRARGLGVITPRGCRVAREEP